MSWSDGRVAHLRLPPCRDFVSVSEPGGICLSFTTQYGCVVEIAGRTTRRDVPTGCVGVAGLEPIAWLRVEQPSDVIEVLAAAALRQAVAEELGAPQAADLADLHGDIDPVVWAIAARFRSAARRTTDMSDLERDHLVRLLYRRIFETHFGGRSPQRGDGTLNERRLRRVTEFIEANLRSELTLAQLADAAALSPFHFARSFRQTTGLTPHRYVRGRRLEHARALIARATPVSEAAQALGFQHPRHFVAAYRRHHGFAPRHTPPS